jgi:hypothetical protein
VSTAQKKKREGKGKAKRNVGSFWPQTLRNVDHLCHLLLIFLLSSCQNSEEKKLIKNSNFLFLLSIGLRYTMHVLGEQQVADKFDSFFAFS